MNQTEYGTLLRMKRKKERYQQRHLAEWLDVSVGYISDIERGLRRPFGPEENRILADKLKTPFRELQIAAVLSRGAWIAPCRNEIQREAIRHLINYWDNEADLKNLLDRIAPKKDFAEILQK
jgi:transcriptional regulator with XRE-family HTH domain